MLHRLVLKVTKFQLPPLKRLSTVFKNSSGGYHGPPMSNRVNIVFCGTFEIYIGSIVFNYQEHSKKGFQGVFLERILLTKQSFSLWFFCSSLWSLMIEGVFLERILLTKQSFSLWFFCSSLWSLMIESFEACKIQY